MIHDIALITESAQRFLEYNPSASLKALKTLFGALVWLAQVDSRSSKKNTPAVENRLLLALRSIRLVAKGLKNTASVCEFAISIWDPVPSKPIKLELAKILAQASHRFVGNDQKYLALVRFLVGALCKALKTDYKNITQSLFLALHNVATSSYGPSPRLCLLSDEFAALFAEVVFSYTQSVQSSYNAANVLEVASYVVINYVLDNKSLCVRVCENVLRSIPKLHLFNLPTLKERLIVFLMLATDILGTEVLKELLIDTICIVDAHIVRGSDRSYDLPLDAVDTCCIPISTQKPKHWFQLRSIYAKSHHSAWLSRIVLVKLLVLYFASLEPPEPTTKKRRTDSVSVSDLLLCSGSLEELITNLIPLDPIYACQLLIFAVSLGYLNGESSFNQVRLLLSDHPGWAALCLLTIVESSETAAPVDSMVLVLKTAVQSVDGPYSTQFCSLATAILRKTRQCVKLREAIHSDSLVRVRVTMLVDLAGIKGPSKLENHSFVLWSELYAFFSDYLNSFHEMMLVWLLLKQDQLEAVLSQNWLALSAFLCWIWGKELKLGISDLYGSDGQVHEWSSCPKDIANVCILWQQNEPFLIRSLFQNTPPSSSESNSLRDLKLSLSLDGPAKLYVVRPVMTQNPPRALTERFIDRCIDMCHSFLTACSLDGTTSIAASKIGKRASRLVLSLVDFCAEHGSNYNGLESSLEECLKSLLDAPDAREAATSITADFITLNSKMFPKRAQNVARLVLLNRTTTEPQNSGLPPSRESSVLSHRNSPALEEDELGEVRRSKLQTKPVWNFKLLWTYQHGCDTSNLMKLHMACSMAGRSNTLDDGPIFSIIESISEKELVPCFIAFYKLFTANQTRISSLNRRFLRAWSPKLLSSGGEAAACCACLLASLCVDRFWDYERDLADVVKFLRQDIHVRLLGFILELQRLLLKLVAVAYEPPQGVHSDLITQLVRVSFDDLITVALGINSALTLLVSEDYRDLFGSLPPLSLAHAYRTVYSSFETPQRTLETFYAFAMFLCVATYRSSIATSFYLFNVLEYSRERFNPIILYCFNYSSRFLGFQSSQYLLKAYRMEIFYHWYTTRLLLDFPYEPFSYESKKSFFKENRDVIFPLAFVTKNQEDRDVLLSYISEVSGFDIKEMVMDSYPQIVAWLYMQTSWRNEVFQAVPALLGLDLVICQTQWLAHCIFRVLEIIDVSGPKQMSVFEGPFNHSDIEYSPLDCGRFCVSAQTGKKLIEELVKNTVKKKRFWEVGAVKLILDRLILSLPRALARRVRVLMVLAGETAGKEPIVEEVVIVFMNRLQQRDQNKCLDLETSYLIRDALTFSSRISHSTALFVGSHVVRLRCAPLLKWFLDFYYGQTQNDLPQYLAFKQCAAALQDDSWRVSPEQLQDIIQFLRGLKALEAFLFMYFELPGANIGTVTRPIVQVAEVLLKMEGKGFPDNFFLWKASYLGQFYAKSGHSLTVPNPGKTLRNVELAFARKKVALVIVLAFTEIKRWYLSTSGADHRFLADCLGALVRTHKKDPAVLEAICDVKGIFGELGDLYLLNSGAVERFHASGYALESVPDLSELGSSLLQFASKYRDCVLECTQSILKELASKWPFSRILALVVHKMPAIAPEIFAYVLLFYVDSVPSAEFGIIKDVIHNWFDTGATNLSVDAKKFILNLCLKLRIGAKAGHRRSAALFLSSACRTAFHSALDLGLWKVALMFYESYDGTDLPESALEQIYQCVNAEDVKYAISQKPTLANALRGLMQIGSEAALESIVRGFNKSETSMISDLSASGYPGLAKLARKGLVEQAQRHYSSNQDYKWAWKLGEWALPDDTASYDGIIYTSIRHNNDSVLKCALKLRDSQQALDERCANEDIDHSRTIRLLGVLWGIRQAKALNEETYHLYVENITHYQIETSSWMFHKDLALFEDILVAKQCVLSQAPSAEARLMQIVELHSYANLATQHGAPQKALNIMSQIENANNQLQTDFRDILAKKQILEDADIVTRFAVATTLWLQKESEVSISILKQLRMDIDGAGKSPLRESIVTLDLVDAFLVEWLYTLKHESPATILAEYIQEDCLKSPAEVISHRGLMCHSFARFCDAQLREGNFDTRIARHKAIAASKEKDIAESLRLKSTDATKYAHKVKKQAAFEKNQLRSLVEAKDRYAALAVRFYLHSAQLGDTFEAVDRFCALWLRYSENEEVSRIVDSNCTATGFPNYKILPWISQLSLRLSTSNSVFQRALKRVLVHASVKHPYHTLFSFKSLKLQKRYNKNPDSVMRMRIEACRALWQEMAANPVQKKYLDAVDTFCDAAVELANQEVSKTVRKIPLEGRVWSSIQALNIPLPTKKIPVKRDSDYSQCEYIRSVNDIVEISLSGISRPKIATFVLSLGSVDKVLLKGNTDDLRQDAIMEQVFEKVNMLLKNDRESDKRKLKMRTYRVVPLGPQAGLIEFVPNSIAFMEAVGHYHRKHDRLSFKEATLMMKDWMPLPTSERIKRYEKELLPKIQPCLREFFFVNFTNPYNWFESKLSYSRGTAVSLMVGYIVGLGDRHCNNILLDKATGDPVHIDLGVAFDQGKLLFVPETVPFRLTRDVVDGMGVCGVEGVFRKSCEHTYRVLRSEKEKIDGILDILRWDPLYMWTISPLRRRRLQEQLMALENGENVDDLGFEALRILAVVQEKLSGDGLSVEAVVRLLILEAMDVRNLALLYCGWSPFF